MFQFLDPEALNEFVRLKQHGLTEAMLLAELARSKDTSVSKHLVRIAAARNQIHGPCEQEALPVEHAAAEAATTYGEEVVRLALNVIIRIAMDLVTNADRVPHGIGRYIDMAIAESAHPHLIKPETRDHILWCIANIQNGVSAAYAIDDLGEGDGNPV